MDTTIKSLTIKTLVCAAVLVLAACGNKGALVQADSPEAQGDGAPATASQTGDTGTTAPATEPVEPSVPADSAVPPTDGDDDGDG